MCDTELYSSARLEIFFSIELFRPISCLPNLKALRVSVSAQKLLELWNFLLTVIISPKFCLRILFHPFNFFS